MGQKKSGYAFISYSSENQQIADSFRKLLNKENIASWMAPYDIPAGSKYGSVLNEALSNCACLVLLLTNESQNSQFVAREVERAVAYNKPIIPLQLEELQLNSEFQFFIGSCQIIAVHDFRTDRPGIRRALDGIRCFVGQEAAAPSGEASPGGSHQESGAVGTGKEPPPKAEEEPRRAAKEQKPEASTGKNAGKAVRWILLPAAVLIVFLLNGIFGWVPGLWLPQKSEATAVPASTQTAAAPVSTPTAKTVETTVPAAAATAEESTAAAETSTAAEDTHTSSGATTAALPAEPEAETGSPLTSAPAAGAEPTAASALPTDPALGDILTFGAYEQDNDTTDGRETIEWIVLDRDGTKALLISRYALDCRPYHDDMKSSVTWETCTLRAWLNEIFPDAAFSETDQKRIVSVEVRNPDNGTYGTDGGNPTTDRIFLLSIDEANGYFASDDARKCTGTEYAYAQGAEKAEDGGCRWWLRSPGIGSQNAAGVSSKGRVDSNGAFAFVDYAVRPAMWVDTGSAGDDAPHRPNRP